MRSLTPVTHATAFASFLRSISRTQKATLLLFSLAMLLADGAAAVRRQSALDGSDPNPNGPVDVVVVQPDGGFLPAGTLQRSLAQRRDAGHAQSMAEYYLYGQKSI